MSTEKLYRIRPLDWQPRDDGFAATSMGVEYILYPALNDGWFLSWSVETSAFPQRVVTPEIGKEVAEDLRLERWAEDLEEYVRQDPTLDQKAAYSARYILVDANREALADACGLPDGVIAAALDNILYSEVKP